MQLAADPAVLTAAALRVPGVGAGRLRALRDAYGTLAAAVAGATGGGPAPAGFPEALFRRLPSSLDTAAAARRLAEVRSAGLEVLCWDDPRYPAPLWLAPEAPPALLYVQGTLPPTLTLPAPRVRAAAVVGTRRATGRGLALARELARSLAELGVVVVSGLALGIDGAAHEGALDARAVTVAVLGGGHRHLHPPSHRVLARRILTAGGAILSEHPPEVTPEAHLFPLRNRIVSGLSRLVVIVEAGIRSGTNSTAGYAQAQQRDVFACPGRPGDPSVAGTLRLIRDGALPLTEPEDVLCRFRAEPGDPDFRTTRLADEGGGAPRRGAERDGGASARAAPLTPLTPHAAHGGPDGVLLEALYGLDEATLDDLAAAVVARSGRPAPDRTPGRSGADVAPVGGPAASIARLTARLTRLELRGAVVRTASGRYRLPAAERRRRAARDDAEAAARDDAEAAAGDAVEGAAESAADAGGKPDGGPA